MTAANRIEYKVGDAIGDCTYVSEDKLANWKRYCNFRCSCGTQFSARLDSVKALKIRSCGCLHAKTVIVKHGNCIGGISTEYVIYNSMKNRCYSKNSSNYPRYGARGITICDRWLSSFENFLSDMGKRPSPNHSIDRIDNNGNYDPANCRWASRREQARNKRSNINITYNGETKCLVDWAKEVGINYTTLNRRINKVGVDKAFESPKKRILC